MRFGKEIIAWTKTGGKSMLAASPVKINICELKFVPKLEADVVQFSQKAKEFVPLKTIEEAKQYARKTFGIKDFNMISLDTANYILQSFHQIKKAVDSPIGIKKIIGKESIPRSASAAKTKPFEQVAACIDAKNGILTISENCIRHNIANHISILSQKDAANILSYLKIMDQLLSSQANLCEISKQLQKFNINYAHVHEMPNQTVFHEIFHRLHFLNCSSKKDYYKMGKLEELAAWRIKDTGITTEFLSPKVQKIISNWEFIGDYAKTSPCEFVAEVGSAIVGGVEPPKEIMALYYKYGGPKIKVKAANKNHCFQQ